MSMVAYPVSQRVVDKMVSVCNNTRMAKKPRLISDQLRQAIRDSGLTRYRIAKETGLSQVTLSRFFNGERGLTLMRLSTSWAVCLQLTVNLGRKEKGK